MKFIANESVTNINAARQLFKVNFIVDSELTFKEISNLVTQMDLPGFVYTRDNDYCIEVLNVTPNALVTLRWRIHKILDTKSFTYGFELLDERGAMHASPSVIRSASYMYSYSWSI